MRLSLRIAAWSAIAFACGAPVAAQEPAADPEVNEARIEALEARIEALEARLNALDSGSLVSSEGTFDIGALDPVAEEDCVEPLLSLERVYFRICYRPEWALASWVGYALSADRLEGEAERRDNFRADLELAPEMRAELSDYRGSGFDRGHLAPAAAFKRSREAMSTTFLLSNMAPQTPNLNRYTWRILEDEVRELARRSEQIWVFTGNIVPRAPTGGEDQRARLDGRAGVMVPSHCYKVILALTPSDELVAYAFVMENTQRRLGSDVRLYRRSVDEVEALTGHDFFAYLPDAIEVQIEAALAEWPI